MTVITKRQHRLTQGIRGETERGKTPTKSSITMKSIRGCLTKRQHRLTQGTCWICSATGTGIGGGTDGFCGKGVPAQT